MTDLVARVLGGDTRAAARLCRLLDDRAEGYRELAAEIHRSAGEGCVIGVTGSPGAGKSTLVDKLVAAYRARGVRVGVVAVDPTSPFTGGAVLGDRIRMQRHFEDPDVFIRSVATRGALGGLSRSCWDVVRVLTAWGARVVFLETVGVGQDELDVTNVADATVVVLSPGQGDDVQATKAGILECADVFVVNKSDRPGADDTVRDLEGMLALGALTRAAFIAAKARHGAAPAVPHAEDGQWTPPVVKTRATDGNGVEELVTKLHQHKEWSLTEAGTRRRLARARGLLQSFLRDEVSAELESLSTELEGAARRVVEEGADPHGAVATLLDDFRRKR